jgi:hypothetical protein
LAHRRLNATALARAVILLGTIVLAGCNAPHSEETQKDDDATPDVASVAPVKTVALVASTEPVKLEGIATVLNTDTLLQLDADIRSATVAANFSHGQLERFKASTMLSRQMIETAVRQEGIDASVLNLVLTRLQQTWGDKAPFLNADARQALIADIARGSRALVRLDFPDSARGALRNVRVVPLRGGAETKVDTVWPAPSGNLAMPGVSFFGLSEAGPGLRAGDRARVVADSPEASDGVIIPSAALVVYEGKSWCYVETERNKFERTLVSLDAPVGDGFLVRSGFAPGTRVVVKGASVLLAREAAPGSLDDDDDGGGGGGGGSQAPAKDAGKKASGPAPIAQNHTGPRSDAD